MKLKIRLASGWLSAFVFSSQAFAALGGDVSSIEADRMKMKAVLLAPSVNGKYTIYEMQTPSATVVRQYAAPSGEIFAVAWQGPTIPNLQQLFGNYFAEYNDAAKEKHERHGHLAIQRSGLVVYSSGHMRAFSGKAYVSQTLPQGVALNEIR